MINKNHVFFLLSLTSFIYAEKAFVLCHGINTDFRSMEPLAQRIKEEFPHAPVLNVMFGKSIEEDHFCSFININKQASDVINLITRDHRFDDKEIVAIGHSQGGIVLRLVHELTGRFSTLISLGSPQGGFYGVPDIDLLFEATHDPNISYLRKFIRATAIYIIKEGLALGKPHVDRLLYTCLLNDLSFAGYWKDPDDHKLYLRNSTALADMNNEKKHALFQQFYDNMSKLDAYVLVMSDEDEVIKPLASSHMLFFKTGSQEEIMQHISEAEYFTTLGLDKLIDHNKLHFFIVHGIRHREFKHSTDVFELIKPFLHGSSTPDIPKSVAQEAPSEIR